MSASHEPRWLPVARVERDERTGARVLDLAGFTSAHSHAFQYGLRGHTQRTARATGTFWSWRDAMYALALELTPERLYALSRRAFARLARGGVRCVGEFHYLHHQADGTPYDDRTTLADAVVRAALDEGLHIALLRVLYARAGAGRAPEGAQRRFADASLDRALDDVRTLRARYADDPRVRVGVAPHSVRAVPRAWLAGVRAFAHEHADEAGPMPVHMHVAEQQAEVDACLAEHGLRPVELLHEVGLLGPRFTAVHATNLAPHEPRLLAASRSFVCVCPSTESDLGDGLVDLSALRSAGVALCVGADSHVLGEHLGEVRALEQHERLRARARVTFEAPEGSTPALQLLLEGSANGAASLGFDARTEPSAARTTWPLRTRVAVDEPPADLRDVPDEALPDALVFSTSSLTLAP